MSAGLQIRELTDGAEIAGVFALVKELRPHFLQESFVQQVLEQQKAGFRFAVGYAPEPVVMAGFYKTCSLARGRHLFVDDLVTAASRQGQGFGKAMLRYLAGCAEKDGLARIYLDSRDTAVGFYKGVGFTCLTSVPCWIETEVLVHTEDERRKGTAGRTGERRKS